MHWLDIIILLVIVIGGIYGLIRGLVRGLFGILALLGGIWIASRTYIKLATYLPFGNTILTNILSFIIIFLIVAIIVTVIGFIIRKIVHFAFLGWIDKIFGLVFGILIGIFTNWVLCIFILTFAPGGEDVIKDTRFAPVILYAGSYFKRYFQKPILKEIKKPEEMSYNYSIRDNVTQVKIEE